MAQMDDPRFRAERLKGELRGTMERARRESVEIDDPQAAALFEVTAEVLGGLVNAFEHYEAATSPCGGAASVPPVTAPR